MANWQNTLVRPDTPVIDALRMIDESALQVALVTDADGRLLGTVTDGDIRRGLLNSTPLDAPVSRVMNPDPAVASPNDSAQSVLALMHRRQIRHLPITDDQGIVAGLHTADRLTAPPKRENWVVLQAGGLGSRLKPLTDGCPKPLLTVGDKPLLELIIENFTAHGFDRFFVAVNYMAEMVEQQLGQGDRWNVQIEYLREETPLGTAGALGLLPEKPKHPTVVMNADLLTQVHFGQLLDFHAERDARATMAVREYDMQVPFGVVSLDDDRLLDVEEKPIKRFFINAGIYVLEPDVLGLIPQGKPYDMTTLFRTLVNQGDNTAVFPIREYWLDIGRHTDLQKANADAPNLFTRPGK